MSLDDGMTVALEFFALGVLWLFVASVLLGLVDFIKRILG